MWVFCACKSVAQPAVRLGFLDSYGASPASPLELMQLDWIAEVDILLCNTSWLLAWCCARWEDAEPISYSFFSVFPCWYTEVLPWSRAWGGSRQEPAALGPCWEERWGRIMHEVCSGKQSQELLAVKCCCTGYGRAFKARREGRKRRNWLSLHCLGGKRSYHGWWTSGAFGFSAECPGHLARLHALRCNGVALQGWAVPCITAF